MRPDELDSLLSQEESIAASTEFAASVMNKITLESHLPAALGFPWIPVLAGMVLPLLALAAWAFGSQLPLLDARRSPFIATIDSRALQLAAGSTSLMAVSVALAVSAILAPIVAYEWMMYVRARPRR